MKTSIAEKHDYLCPQCGDTLTKDRKGKGFVRHKNNRKCQFGNGKKDE